MPGVGIGMGVFPTTVGPLGPSLSPEDKTFPICVRTERSHPETDDKDLEKRGG